VLLGECSERERKTRVVGLGRVSTVSDGRRSGCVGGAANEVEADANVEVESRDGSGGRNGSVTGVGVRVGEVVLGAERVRVAPATS